MSNVQEVRVLRITRHDPSEEQIAVLQEIARRLVGTSPNAPVVIEAYKETVQDIQALAKRIAETGIHVVEAVLPIGPLADLLNALSRLAPHTIVIQAIMRRELVGNEAVFHFEGYRQVMEVTVRTKDLARKGEDGTFVFSV